MVYKTIPATRITGERGSQSKRPCPRCGVLRSHHGGENRTGLCRDCSGSMTPEERNYWKGK